MSQKGETQLKMEQPKRTTFAVGTNGSKRAIRISAAVRLAADIPVPSTKALIKVLSLVSPIAVGLMLDLYLLRL